MQQLKVLYRKAKARLTGVTPCTFDTRHGHDFERTSEIKSHLGTKYAFFKCKCCPLRTVYDQLTGGFTVVENE